MKFGRIIVKSRKKVGSFIKLPLKLIDSEDITALKEFIPGVVVYGMMINFAAFVIVGIPFTWYSWLGWGFAYIIIEKKIVKWIRSIIHKK